MWTLDCSTIAEFPLKSGRCTCSRKQTVTMHRLAEKAINRQDASANATDSNERKRECASE
eukprot:1226269-Amphidinium_carterae.1